MSYASLLKIPGILQSSTSLAALASLGIHGLLWAVLPVLPFESKSLEPQPQQTVGLIELTPDEQSRLPQSSSDVTLPPFATQPSVLPPLPPPPFQISALPPLPALPSSFQLLPNNSSQNSLRTSLPSPKTVRVPPPPTQNNRSVPSRIAINQPRSVTNRTYYSEETLPKWRRFTPPSISGLPTNRLAPQPFDPNNFLPSPPPLTQQNTNSPQSITPPQNQKVAANQPARLNPTALPEKVPERGKQELLALQRLATNRATRPASPAPEKTPAREREKLETALQQRLRQQPTPDPTGSPSAATVEKLAQIRNWSERQNRVQKKHSNVVTKAPIYRTIATCKREIEGTAVLGVVVNPEGRIISGPDFLDRKGGPGIDLAAKNYVREYGFQRNDDPANQQFHLNFKYDTANCPEPTPESSPDPQTQQSKS